MDKVPMPYLTAALLCERVIEEKNGTLSVIRIADRVEVEIPPGGVPGGYRPVVPISGLVALKSGPAKGSFTLRIIITRPSGERLEGPAIPVELEGEDRGQNFILNFLIGVSEEGLHWFEVVFENQVLSRIPLMVVRKQEPELESR